MQTLPCKPAMPDRLNSHAPSALLCSLALNDHPLQQAMSADQHNSFRVMNVKDDAAGDDADNESNSAPGS